MVSLHNFEAQLQLFSAGTHGVSFVGLRQNQLVHQKLQQLEKEWFFTSSVACWKFASLVLTPDTGFAKTDFLGIVVVKTLVSTFCQFLLGYALQGVQNGNARDFPCSETGTAAHRLRFSLHSR